MKNFSVPKVNNHPDLRRWRHVITQRQGVNIEVNHHPCINFCSSDYLSLATDPKLQRAAIEAISRYGTSSSASPLVAGYYKIHQRAEQAFAEFLQRDRALLFNSGFMANLGVFSGLVEASHQVAMDQYNHVSLLQGLQLSGANLRRYRHSNLIHLQQQIKKSVDWIVTDSVFSMDGDRALLSELSMVAQHHDAMLIADEAHAMGVIGEKGQGLVASLGLSQKEVPLIICPLAKAFAAQGAMVVGDQALIETLLQQAKSYTYSNGLPPMLAAIILAALEAVQGETWRRQKLQELIVLFQHRATTLGLPLLPSTTPIQNIIVGDNTQALALSDHLLSQGFFIKAMRPPTVPKGTARLRILLNTAHEPAMIEQLLQQIASYLC